MIKKFLKQSGLAGVSLIMAASLLPVMPVGLGAAEISDAASKKPVMTKAGSVPVSEEQVTYEEPFSEGTGGCEKFRIPALITLQNGDLLATADARWTTTGDGGGIDSIASVSEDGGKTWQYSFPLYFPDSNGYAGTSATTIIDPGVLEGPDGTIYFIADVNPTGSTTLYKEIPEGTGYVSVDNGTDSGRYLALTKDYNTSWNVKPADDDLSAYPYYVGDLDEDGYAKILKREDGSETGYGVDEWYNLYTIEDGEYQDTLKQTQVNSDFEIQQNAFYKDSEFHVYSIDYLWVITSKDGGRTWEHPRDITDQIKRHTGENGLLVSPGRGISTSTGELAIGFYDHSRNKETGDEENASIVYSADNGRTWKRTEDMQRTEHGGFWTSENEVVELEDGTLRMFARSAQGRICYGDAVKDPETGEYVMSETSVKTDVSVTSTCNVTAIGYSKKINGKQAILVACPAGPGRARGKIYTFLVEEDKTMTLFSEFAVPGAEGGFQYSCLTEMEDGTVALLWEPSRWGEGISILFDKFGILDIAPSAVIEGEPVRVEIEKGKSYTRTYSGTGEFLVSEEADEEVAEIAARQEEENKVITITGTGRGYTRAVIDGVIYNIYVTDNTVFLPSGGEPYVIKDVASDPGAVSSDVFDVIFKANGAWNMFAHVSDTADSLTSFSGSSNQEICISDAEFTFTGSGTTYSIYSESKNTYLKNIDIGTFFQAGSANMTVTKADGGFRICNAEGKRYIIFYTQEMNFNSNTNYTPNYDKGTYEMTLLEKQDSVSEDDVLPGYRIADDIVSGNKYLISYIYDDEHVIVLYPQNGKAEQTKLVQQVNIVKIIPKKIGTDSVTVNGKTYNFKVTDSDCSHNAVVVRGAIEKDCLEDGYTGDTYCAEPDCGILLQEGSVIPAYGSHAWDEGISTKDVTETEDGEKVYTCLNYPSHKKTEIIYAYVYQPLKEEYEEAAKIADKLHLYSGEGVSSLPELVEEGKKIIDSLGGNRSSMIKVTEALKAALGTLSPKSKDELNSELQGLIAAAEKDYKGSHAGVTDKVWKDFKDAYERAQEVTADTAVDVIGERIKALSDAQEALTNEKEALRLSGQEALQKGIREAAAYIAAGESKYTPETWKKFYDAYKAAAGAPETADAAELAQLLLDLQTAQKGLKEAEVIQEPKAGDTETVDGVIYEVTDVAGKKAAVVGAEKAAVKILSSVTIKDKTFTVTSIREKAFFNSKKVKSVVIGGSVTDIGKQAFSGCSRLTSVTIGAKVKSIGKQAFFKCKKLKKITLKCKSLKTVHKTAFKKTPASKVTVTMPKGLKKKKCQKLLKKLQTAGVSKKAKMK